jgi:hypothetical protein
VISVLVALVLLAVSGALALVALRWMEQATAVVSRLDPGTWRDVTAEMVEVTDGLRLAVAERIDR